MEFVLYALIMFFGLASYIVGLKDILHGKYAPSIFSRVVWLLLALVSFAGVVGIGSTKASIILAIVFLIGNLSICIASFKNGSRDFGKLEYLCLVLLAVSIAVWWLFNSPSLSLAISLFAHFIGALPTYKRVLVNPKNESAGFWSLFFIASLLSILASIGEPTRLIIFPIYFALFDGSMTFLSLRR